MTRLVADSGWIMNGGLAQVGSVGVTIAMRSATSCRAVSRSVPGSKISSIDDSCSTDFERIVSSPGMPLSDCSSGIGDERLDLGRRQPEGRASGPRPSAARTRGRRRPGCRASCCTPKNIRAAASATTMYRNFRLEPTIQRSIGRFPSRVRSSVSDRCRYSVPYSSGTPTVTTSVPAGGPCGQDGRSSLVARRRSARG